MTVLVAEAELHSSINSERRVIIEWDKHDGYSTIIQVKLEHPQYGKVFDTVQKWGYGRTKDALRKCLRKFTRTILDECEDKS